MEKVIRFVEGAHTEKGISYWKVEFADGDRATAWDKALIPKLEESIGKPIDLVMKTSPDGKYNNIRGINSVAVGPAMGKTPMPTTTLKEVQQGVRSLNGQEQMPAVTPGMPTRDKSIIAQCLVKAVIGSGGSETHTIEEAVNMYKEALELLG